MKHLFLIAATFFFLGNAKAVDINACFDASVNAALAKFSEKSPGGQVIEVENVSSEVTGPGIARRVVRLAAYNELSRQSLEVSMAVALENCDIQANDAEIK